MTSVIIPAYNRIAMVTGLIGHLKKICTSGIEIIVVDDGSTDSTPTEMAKIKEVVYVRQTNQGPSAARNTGLAQAQGEFIHFLDSDDIPDESFYDEMTAPFADPKVMFTIANYRMANSDGQVINPDYFTSRNFHFFSSATPFSIPLLNIRKFFFLHSLVPPSGVIFRKSFLTVAWNSRIRVGEDRLYTLQNLLSKEGHAWIQPKPSWTYQIHDSNSYCNHKRHDVIAFRENRGLKVLVSSTKDIQQGELLSIKKALARNYQDWAWYCRHHRQHKRAHVLLKKSWTLSPSLKTLRSMAVNWLLAAKQSGR